jgi:hypothetical protein
MTKIVLMVVDDEKAREFVEDATAMDNLIAYVDKDGKDIELQLDSIEIVNG